MRPNDLAQQIGVTGLQLRNFLRAAYPRDKSMHGAAWFLTDDQIAAVRLYFAGASRRYVARAAAIKPPAPSATAEPAVTRARDWFWEGSVQAVLVRYLEAEGWTIEATANTAIKEPGDDIRASKGGRVLRVEVKGWPTKGYADPARASEIKRTSPSTQAAHWFSQAILHVMRDLGRHPKDLVAIGLPDWPRFRALLVDTEAPLRRLGVGVFLVSKDGLVETRLPLHAPRSAARLSCDD